MFLKGLLISTIVDMTLVFGFLLGFLKGLLISTIVDKVSEVVANTLS